MSTLQRLMHILTLSAVIVGPSPSSAQTSSIKFSLQRFMEDRQLQSEDIFQVLSVLRLAPVQESAASIAAANPAWYSLKVVQAHNPDIKAGLKIRFGLLNYEVESCVRDSCRTILKSSAKSSEFSLDGVDYTLDLQGFPCDKHKSCQLNLASWSLAQLVLNSGALSTVPSTLSFVHHRKGLSVFDADNKRLWLDLFTEGVPLEFGRLKQIQELKNGVLLLQFEQVYLALDLARDLAVKASATGLDLATQGLASLRADSFQKIYERPGKYAAHSIPIYFDQETVAWPDFSLILDQGWNITKPMIGHPQHFVSLRKAADGRFDFLALSHAKVKVWQLTSDKHNFDQIAEISVASSVLREDLLVDGADVLLSSNEGIRLLRSGKSLPTSLSMSNHKIILHQSSDAFVREKSATKCLWRHFINHPHFTNSFKESGFTVPCAKLESFTANDKAVTVSSFHAGRVTIDSLKK